MHRLTPHAPRRLPHPTEGGDDAPAVAASTQAGRAPASRRWRVFLPLLAWLPLLQPVAAADATVSREYRLKAAFLCNFTKFIEWPAARFADAASPVVIGVLAKNPFGAELEKIAQGRTVKGRDLVVKLLATADEAPTVHILFVPAGEEPRLAATDAWRKIAVVVVGESPRFAPLGGVITFQPEADKVRFAIDLAAAQSVGLKISAQLLKLAVEVHRKI